MGLTHLTVALRALGRGDGTFEASFLVNTGATDCLVPASKLSQIGVEPVGKAVYEKAMVLWTTTKDENGRELSYGGDDRGRIRAAHRKVGGKLVLGIRVSRFESVTALREE